MSYIIASFIVIISGKTLIVLRVIRGTARLCIYNSVIKMILIVLLMKTIFEYDFFFL